MVDLCLHKLGDPGFRVSPRETELDLVRLRKLGHPTSLPSTVLLDQSDRIGIFVRGVWFVIMEVDTSNV